MERMPVMRTNMLLALGFVSTAFAAHAGYIEDRAAATKQMEAGEHEKALAAFQAMAAGPVTDRQKSDALDQAALCAYSLKQYDRAMELARSIPLEADAKLVQMGIMMTRNQSQEVIARFGSEDLDAWPDPLKGRASYNRGRAFQAVGNGEAAALDLERASKYLLADGRTRNKALTLLAGTYSGLLHNDEQALAAYRRLYDLGDVIRQGIAVCGMAEILKRQGRYDDALAQLQRVDLTQVGDPYLKGRILELWGDVLVAAGKKADAAARYKTAFQVDGAPDSIRQSCEKKLAELASE
jgi:tetratricopeptide (TPR) repeat protein